MEPARPKTVKRAITPGTETTSHYFWGQAHDFDVKNAETTNRARTS